MTGAGVFIACCGMIGVFIATTAPTWRERLTVGAGSVALFALGLALLTL